MTKLKKGDFALMGETPVVVVGTEEDDFVPEEHVAVWYGYDENEELSAPNVKVEVYTVPEEYCKKIEIDAVRH